MIRGGAALAALALIAAPGAAQDIPSPYDGAVGEFGQRQLENTLARRRIEQAQASQKSSGSLDARRRASCAALPRFVAQHGRGDPRVQKLTALCRRDGYLR